MHSRSLCARYDSKTHPWMFATHCSVSLSSSLLFLPDKQVVVEVVVVVAVAVTTVVEEAVTRAVKEGAAVVGEAGGDAEAGDPRRDLFPRYAALPLLSSGSTSEQHIHMHHWVTVLA